MWWSSNSIVRTLDRACSQTLMHYFPACLSVHSDAGWFHLRGCSRWEDHVHFRNGVSSSGAVTGKTSVLSACLLSRLCLCVCVRLLRICVNALVKYVAIYHCICYLIRHSNRHTLTRWFLKHYLHVGIYRVNIPG